MRLQQDVGLEAGCLDDLLVYAVRLRRAAGDPKAGGCDNFCVAPLHEVGADVLQQAKARPYLSPARPGFRSPGSRVRVVFEVVGPSGDINGDFRARAVRLAVDCEGVAGKEVFRSTAAAAVPVKLEVEEEASPQRLLLRAPPSPADEGGRPLLSSEKSRRGLGAFRAWWQSLETPGDSEASAGRLERHLEQSLERRSGPGILLALRTAAAGLAGASAAKRRWPGWRELGFREALDLRLRTVVIACLSRLDLADERVRLELGPTLQHLRRIAPDSSDEARCGRLQWSRIRALLTAGLGDVAPPPLVLVARKPKRSCFDHGRCSVPGCTQKAHGKVHVADFLGPAGRRCCRHGARQCNVVGCWRFAKVTMPRADSLGPPGRRCHAHGLAVAKLCSVPGCLQHPRRTVLIPDGLGPPGPRCQLHGGSRCTAYGCCKAAWGGVSMRDDYGPPGGRCHLHGGVGCSFPGCRNRPLGIVRTEDRFGPPGYRCDTHGLFRRNRQAKGTLQLQEETQVAQKRKFSDADSA